MRRDHQEINAILNASLLTEGGVEICDVFCKNGVISDIRKSSPENAKLVPAVLDAKKRIVVPGFIDCHVHLFGVALSEITIDLYGCRSIAEMQQRIAKGAHKTSSLKGDGWLIGRGWDQDLFEEKKFPTRIDIDSVTGSRSALMVRICWPHQRRKFRGNSKG